jgi:hypothetical protein
MVPSEAELARMRYLLGRLIELSGMSRVAIGERLGGGPHLVRRILAGDSELKVRHILESGELIGVHPSEFFHILFKDPPAEPSPLIRKMDAIVAELDGYRAGARGQARAPEAGGTGAAEGARAGAQKAGSGRKGRRGGGGGRRRRATPG